MPAPTDFKPQLALTFLASIATAVMWCGLGFVAKHGYGFPEWLTFLLFAASGIVYCLGALLAHTTLERLKGRISPEGAGDRIDLSRHDLPADRLHRRRMDSLGRLVRGEHLLGFRMADRRKLHERGYDRPSNAKPHRLVEHLLDDRHRDGTGGNDAVPSGGFGTMGDRPSGACKHHRRLDVFWYRPEPMILDSSRQEERTIGPNYRSMLSSCRVMMPLSYVLIGAVGPIMPYRLSDLEVSLVWETPLTSVWLFVRVAAVAIMWRMSTWHGRWGSLVIGGTAMAVGFILITAGPSTWTVILGLAPLGAVESPTTPRSTHSPGMVMSNRPSMKR